MKKQHSFSHLGLALSGAVTSLTLAACGSSGNDSAIGYSNANSGATSLSTQTYGADYTAQGMVKTTTSADAVTTDINKNSVLLTSSTYNSQLYTTYTFDPTSVESIIDDASTGVAKIYDTDTQKYADDINSRLTLVESFDEDYEEHEAEEEEEEDYGWSSFEYTKAHAVGAFTSSAVANAYINNAVGMSDILTDKINNSS